MPDTTDRRRLQRRTRYLNLSLELAFIIGASFDCRPTGSGGAQKRPKVER